MKYLYNLSEEKWVLYLYNREKNVPSRLSYKSIVAAHALGHMMNNYKLLVPESAQ